MTTQNYPHRVGEIRPTQLMFTYGVGAIVDLPFLSALVMGLDDWQMDPTTAPEIHEERLLAAVRKQLGHQIKKMVSPPIPPNRSGRFDPFGPEARIGVPVATFPRWMVCPRCHLLAPLRSGLFKLKENPYRPDRTQYVHSNCSKMNKVPPTVVPARFLVACKYGHLDDFPWIYFVHKGLTDCESTLQLTELGPSGEARDLEIRCLTCDDSRRLAEAFGSLAEGTLPRCRRRRPHLRDFAPHSCDGQLRTILLGASNLWFPDTISTLAIPTDAVGITKLVGEKWVTLQHVPDVKTVAFMRQIGQLGELYRYSDEQIWQAIERKRATDSSDQSEETEEIKQPEWEMLTQPESVPVSNDFKLRQVSVPAGFEQWIEKVVLVEKVREVRALLGFTRIDAPGELGERGVINRRMRLSRQEPKWVPASEVRGEGIFLQFREEAMQAFIKQPAIRRRDQQFLDSHISWRHARSITPEEEEYPGMRYILLHTFAHALMRQLVLECGYSAASVRERLYSRNRHDSDTHPEPMAGILIYTAAPDSEGTLGGLVTLGQPETLARHLNSALRDATLCGSDPLCAEHPPSQDGITLHAAACHACLFAPETSCEQGNRYLDRSVLVPTIANANRTLHAFTP
ncbi:MAG: DrmB family protein [Ardenticatenaceae bacterium]